MRTTDAALQVEEIVTKRRLVLAYDMVMWKAHGQMGLNTLQGLGKTVISLVAAKALHEILLTRTIVLCPASLKVDDDAIIHHSSLILMILEHIRC